MNFKMKLNYLFILICATICDINCYKILMVFPLPSKSHFILGQGLATGLLNAGHDITYITPYDEKPPQGNGTYRKIIIPDCHPKRAEQTAMDFNSFDIEKSSPFISFFFMNFFGSFCSKTAFESENVKKLLQSNEKFDAVIMETLYTEGLAAFACHYNAPLIILNPLGGAQWVNNVVGSPTPPSYVANPMLAFSNKMTFWQRSQNYLMSVLLALNHKYLNFPRHTQLVREHFPNCPYSVEELTRDAALILTNTHESCGFPTPSVPNIINIGGFHISRTKKKLPNDLQKILDNAKNGAVYFSFGSHIKPSEMPMRLKKIFLKVLGSLKQTVLWKWDNKDFAAETPGNVVIRDWFPQQEILAHPNLKLFITHGGLLSMTETIYLGVPILAIPVLGDQKYNAIRAGHLEIGQPLFFSEISEQTFSSLVNDLLTNPKYSENIKRRSEIFKDRQNHPLDTAVYWIEYVIRHKGAPHLRVTGRELPWYQYYSLDIFVVWSVLLFTLFYLIYILIKRVCCKAQKRQKIKKS